MCPPASPRPPPPAVSGDEEESEERSRSGDETESEEESEDDSENDEFDEELMAEMEELKIACQPIAINSGNTWPKKGLRKINTVLTISILKPIEPGLERKIFLKELENIIYSELDVLG